MELRQLEYFQMASRLRNITRAAERLRVSQPNITVAIKKLEAELGIQLFDRSQKQLALTPEGAVFLNRVELALRNIQDAVLEVNDYKQLQKGTIWKREKPIHWQCLVCGYIYEGTEPPVKCPACDHPYQHYIGLDIYQ